MRRLKLPEEHEGFRPVEPEDPLDDDVIVCRCEEITAGEIRKAIRKYHATTVTEVKRRVRAGMGLCQGQTCAKLVKRIVATELGVSPALLEPATSRAPMRPLEMKFTQRKVRTMSKTADVIIVGSGVIGCATAYYLAKKGTSVIRP